MTSEERKARHPYAHGSKEKVLADLERYMDTPDEPMVPDHLANRLEATRNMNVSPAKMWEDGGHKANAIRYLAARAGVVRPPQRPAEVFKMLDEYFAWSTKHQVPITLGALALWFGVTQIQIGKIERNTNNPERAAAFAAAKECVRTFLEMSAFDNTLNPILWFHTHKTEFGAVENQQVTVRVEDNTTELTDDELNERMKLLESETIVMEQGEDGVYREASQS